MGQEASSEKTTLEPAFGEVTEGSQPIAIPGGGDNGARPSGGGGAGAGVDTGRERYEIRGRWEPQRDEVDDVFVTPAGSPLAGCEHSRDEGGGCPRRPGEAVASGKLCEGATDRMHPLMR